MATTTQKFITPPISKTLSPTSSDNMTKKKKTVFSTFLGCSTAKTTNTKEKKKDKCKEQFLSYLSEHCIFNDVGYDKLLGKSSELRSFEQRMQPNQLETLKKTIFRQNYLVAAKNYELPKRETLSYLYTSAVIRLLETVAEENCMTVNELSTILANWAFNLNPKRKGIVLFGRSNSGKTFLSSLMCNMYHTCWCI